MHGKRTFPDAFNKVDEEYEMSQYRSRNLVRMLCGGLVASALLAFAPAVLSQSEALPNFIHKGIKRTCSECGTVVTTNRKDEKGSGTAGTIIGGVGGAVAGNVLGHNTTSTVIGGVGGAVAGNVIGKQLTRKKIWSVQVKMDNGSVQDVDYTTDPQFKQGERVRLLNRTLTRM